MLEADSLKAVQSDQGKEQANSKKADAQIKAAKWAWGCPAQGLKVQCGTEGLQDIITNVQKATTS